jgi:AAT family amino acid transporter
MAVRLFLFYVLALGVVAAIFPWTQTGGSVAVAESPFVKVLALTGIPHAAGIMNFVIISAALSGMNTNVYLCSRMLFSLSRGGYAPRHPGPLSKAGAPVAATLVSGACILMAAVLAKFTPKAYAYLQGVALFGAIIVWMLILVSHLRFRRCTRPRPAGAHAAFPGDADRRPGTAGGAARHHGPGQGLERLLDRRRPLAGSC